MKTEAPHHAILLQPWTYKVVGLRYEFQPSAFAESYLELDLARGDELRTLRFSRPQQLQIGAGFPACPGLVIYDLSDRGLDDVRLEVSDFEAGAGGIRFFASSVIALR